MKLDLYFYRGCPFCERVLQLIEELSLKEKVNYKNTMESVDDAQFHLKTTGRRTVPCLYINDKPLFESSEIINWLNENKNNL